jgi:uncharacterized protein (TIGR02646 family)
MQYLPFHHLPVNTLATLATYQAEVDDVAIFAERVATGKKLFKSRNNSANLTFKIIKKVLTKMCSGVRRCVYCEDSLADEVEHIYPKHFYPDRVFSWPNYVYACGPCNGPKESKFAVFTAGADSKVELVRTSDAPLPPPVGISGLLDPRVEDPAQMLALDIRGGTFWFVPRSSKGTLDYERATYTIETLGLNKRDVLPSARRAAYKDYIAHLTQYVVVRTGGGDESELQRLAHEIATRQHPTVWAEMRRQHQQLHLVAPLFAAAPEALSWGPPIAR